MHSDQSPGSKEVNPVARPKHSPRLWPVTGILVFQVFGMAAAWRFSTTSLHGGIGFIGVPLLSTLLLMIWWLAASRSAWLDRLLGVVIFMAVAAGIYFVQPANGEFLLMAAIPALTSGFCLGLILTYRLKWSVRRWVIVAILLGLAALFTLIRAEGIGADFVPLLAWRWQPTSEQLLASPGKSGGTAVLPEQLSPADWPAFRGPARDGRIAGVSFSADWKTPPRERWRRPVGPGWSAFIAVGDYLFTQEQRGEEESVTCYRAETGEEVWASGVPVRFDNNMGNGPRATPTFDQGKIYALGATGILQCLDAATGKMLWKRDITQDAPTGIPQWGFSCSPLVVENRVVVFPGGPKGSSIIAYACASGEIAWRGGEGTGGYSSPQLTQIAGVSQVLVTCNAGLFAVQPETGAPLWSFPLKAGSNPRVDQPLLIDGNTLLFGCTSGTARVRVEKTGDAWTPSEMWNTKRFRPYFNDYVYHQGNCYGFDGNRLACIDAATGENRWEGPRCGGQVLLVADMHALFVLTEAGQVLLVAAEPEAYREIASFSALSGKTWNHPVIAHGRLFVRNSQEAACFELSAPSSS